MDKLGVSSRTIPMTDVLNVSRNLTLEIDENGGLSVDIQPLDR